MRPTDWFEDVTRRTHIEFAYDNGRSAGRFLMIESFGGGVAIVDYDLDDVWDVFFTGGGTISRESPVEIRGLPSALYRNLGDWRFDNVTSAAGFAAAPDYSQGCAVADYDADGFPDVLVCCYGLSRLYRNAGDGTFRELADPASLPAQGWGTAAAFGDLDADGFADLFLARYTEWTPETDVKCFGANKVRDLCGPTAYPGARCQFFHNDGQGGFVDWSERVGLLDGVHGLGVVATDFDGDGRVDFYVASDALPNHLYLGVPDARLREVGMLAGVAVGEWGQPEASMGIDVADYNGDGLPDLFVTNFEKEDNALYRNLGEGLWMHSTVAAGLSGASRMRVGFGTAFCDFDADGWPDLFVLNGNPIYTTAETPFAQLPQLFRNLQGRRFADVSQDGGPYFGEEHSGRGSAVGDLNNDGAHDLAIVLMNEPVRLLRNRQPPRRYVRVQLRPRHGEPDATGARVSCDFAGRRLTHFVARGAGYFSQSDARIIFPCDESAASATVTVVWPGRQTEVFRELSCGRTHWLVEGRGEAQHEPP